MSRQLAATQNKTRVKRILGMTSMIIGASAAISVILTWVFAG